MCSNRDSQEMQKHLSLCQNCYDIRDHVESKSSEIRITQTYKQIKKKKKENLLPKKCRGVLMKGTNKTKEHPETQLIRNVSDGGLFQSEDNKCE